MSKQTALKWFKDVAYPYLDKESKEYVDILFNHALQMEREQIEKSYTSGREQWQKYEFAHSNYENDVEIPTPRKYYNDTYGGQDEK